MLLGDSEMAEGSQWEAIQIAAHYKLNNLIGIIDVNRLGQRGETMYGHDLKAYEKRIAPFGWETIVIDGHDFDEILGAYHKASTSVDRPVMIIARTIKGKGVSFIEDKNGWHGKTLNKEQFAQALAELGDVDRSLNRRDTKAGGYETADYRATQQSKNRIIRRGSLWQPEGLTAMRLQGSLTSSRTSWPSTAR